MDIDVCINSDNKEYAKEKANYDTYINQVANIKDFEELDYFWIVKQAKNVMESSLVMFGSNSATGRIQESKEEPSNDTLTDKEPTHVTQEKKKFNINLFT